jgi:hypothetical protein
MKIFTVNAVLGNDIKAQGFEFEYNLSANKIYGVQDAIGTYLISTGDAVAYDGQRGFLGHVYDPNGNPNAPTGTEHIGNYDPSIEDIDITKF